MRSLSSRKGIILAGGFGRRLSPLTFTLSKQLMPIYDKPMIYYPLTTLMLCDIREILIITTQEDQDIFKRLLGNGSKFGVQLSYEVQLNPDGIAHALLIAEHFLAGSSFAMVLGDNLFHGNDLVSLLKKADSKEQGNTIFAYPVSNPEQYGVIQMTSDGHPIRIEEKPSKFLSKYAVTGLYFFDNSVLSRAKQLKPSSRGELEITSILQEYLEEDLLNVLLMGRGMTWLDTGTFDSLLEAASYIRALQKRQGLKVGCPEEVAWRKGWISDNKLLEISKPLMDSDYGKYLLKLIDREI